MKRVLRAVGLTAILAVLLCVSALAANTDYGITDFAAAKADDAASSCDVTAALKDAGGESVASVAKKDRDGAEHQFSPGAVRFDLTLTDDNITADKQYLVMVLNKATNAPTKDDVVFIDQMSSAAGSVTFPNVYPILSIGKAYHVYLSSNDADAPVTSLTEVASFAYSRDPSNPWSMGDVDRNNDINSTDALRVLQYAVGKFAFDEEQRILADVNPADHDINSTDALWILQAAVGKRALE